MSLIFCDSFDHYDITRGIYKYDFGTPPIASGGRRGSQCLSWAFNTGGIVRNIGAQSTIISGAAFNLTSSSYFPLGNKWGAGAIFNNSVTSRSMLMALGYQGVMQCGLTASPDGALHVVRGSAFDLGANSLASELVASSDVSAVRFNQWAFIEWKVTPTTVIVRVNGTEVINDTVGTTQDGLPGSFTQFYVHGGSSESADGGWAGKMDDLYVFNALGDEANDFTGDVRVEYKRPDGPGNVSGSTVIGTNPAATRWQSVDDVTPDDDVTAVEFEDEGDADSYTHEDIDYDVATVFAVQGVAFTRKQDAGLSAFVHTNRCNSIDLDGTITHYPAGGDWAFNLTPFDESADGPWTLERFNSSEFGMKREAV